MFSLSHTWAELPSRTIVQKLPELPHPHHYILIRHVAELNILGHSARQANWPAPKSYFTPLFHPY